MSERSYLFGPLEKRGVVAGLRGGQLAMIGFALIIGLALMSSGFLPSGVALPATLIVVASAVALAFINPMGRGVDEWLPVLSGWAMAEITGSNKWTTFFPLLGDPDVYGEKVDLTSSELAAVDKTNMTIPLVRQNVQQGRPQRTNSPKKTGFAVRISQFLAGMGIGDDSGGARSNAKHAKQSTALAPPFKDLTILELPATNQVPPFGVIKDVKAGLYTAVIAVRGDTFNLLDSGEKEQRLQSWADVLGSLCRPTSFVHRIQWIERSLPDDGDALNRYLSEARRQSASSPTYKAYVDLLEEHGAESQQHEVFIAMQISAVKAGRIIKKAGGGDKGACLVLSREIRQFAQSLSSANIEVLGLLSPRMIGACIRNAIDPEGRRLLAKKARQNPAGAGVAPLNAWPTATVAKWDYFQTDGVYHATYWISEWPRLEVGPDFLAPLIVRSARLRTMSVVMQPIETSKAQREVESAKTAYVSDEALRREHGYIPSERRRRELDGVMRREQELADGFAEFRYSGYVTVTATSIAELDDACNEVEQTAAQSRLELRRLYGEQDAAFACALPLCKGLSNR